MPVESTVRRRDDHTFGLIETLRYEPAIGCVLAKRHLDRMADSARHFQRAFDRTDAARMLGEVKSDMPLRVRLFLDQQDTLTCTKHDFTQMQQGTVWNVAIAETRLDSADSLLPHKTSHRDIYDRARAEFPVDQIEEVLMENENGFLCEGTITSLFVRKAGTLITPRLSHGLLRGVLRQELLDTGLAKEGDLTRADFAGHHLFVGNSLRGLIPAKLVENA